MAEGPKPRILVIDDAALVRRYYREALEPAGYEVEEALNGLEALEKLLQAPADLLIVDVNMPQMDGLTFLAILRRQEPAIASIPAVVISTEAKAEDREAARAAGANFYLVKPISAQQLTDYAGHLSGGPA